MTPGMLAILIPTSTSRLEVIGGRATSKYNLPFPTVPPTNPLSVLPKCGNAMWSVHETVMLITIRMTNMRLRFMFLNFFVQHLFKQLD